MAPQVGLERCPEVLTAETILLKFAKNARKTSVDAGLELACRLSLKAGNAAESAVGRTKVGHFSGVVLFGIYRTNHPKRMVAHAPSNAGTDLRLHARPRPDLRDAHASIRLTAH